MRKVVYQKKKEKRKDAHNKNQLEAIVEYIAAYCKKEHITKLPDICMPPLPEILYYTDSARRDTEEIYATVGLLVDPDRQLQEALNLNVTSQNYMIIGSAQTKYCQYVYIDDSQDIVVEMTKDQREKWISKLKEKIDDILQQQKESKVYNFNFEKDYKTLQIDVTKEVLDQEKMTSFMSYFTALLYHSEIYQVLNGNTDWAVQVITEDWDTGKELINIEYPDEGFRLSDENWENI